MEDHLHVAIQLMQAQRLPEARQLLRQFTKRQSRNADGWFLLGQLERTLQNWPEALEALRRAHALSGGAVAVTEYLAMVQLLSNQGREAPQSIANFASVLKAAPQSPSAQAIAVNLQTLGLRSDDPATVLQSVEPYFVAENPVGAERQRMAGGLCIAHFLSGNLAESAAYATETLGLVRYALDGAGEPLPGDYPFYHRYVEFIQALLAELVPVPAGGAELHIIGESHALTVAHRTVGQRRVVPHLMMGAKAFMLAHEKGESWQYAFRQIVQKLPKDVPIVAVFGEIDCRTSEGIMQQWSTRADYAMEHEVASLVAAYVKFVKLAQMKRLAPTFIYGVPAAARAVETEIPQGRTAADFTRLIAHFNACLKAEAQTQGLGFVDVHAATVGSDGWAKAGVHLDKVHLKSEVAAQALTAILA